MVDRTSLIRTFLSGHNGSRCKRRFRSLLQKYSTLVTLEKTPVPFSARQGREFCVHGVCGLLDLPEGPGALWPLLAALQWIHVGKSTIVGLGQLQIETMGT